MGSCAAYDHAQHIDRLAIHLPLRHGHRSHNRISSGTITRTLARLTHTCTHSQAPRARLHVHALAPLPDCACVTGSASALEALIVPFVSHAHLTVALMVQGGGSAKKAISSKAAAVGQVTLQRAVHSTAACHADHSRRAR